jgi:hypothetical protein
LLFGGDPGNAALLGFAFGAAGYELFGLELRPFGESAGLAGTANYLVNSGVHGALLEGAYGVVSHRDIGASLLSGFEGGVESAIGNMAIGHAVGKILIDKGKAPVWRDGAWYYESADANGVTLGNVIIGHDLDTRSAGCIAGIECGGHSTATAWEHEKAHIPQSYVLGGGYLLAHGLSMSIGSLIGSFPNPGNWGTAGHTYGFLERDWIRVTDYYP